MTRIVYLKIIQKYFIVELGRQKVAIFLCVLSKQDFYKFYS